MGWETRSDLSEEVTFHTWDLEEDWYLQIKEDKGGYSYYLVGRGGCRLWLGHTLRISNPERQMQYFAIKWAARLAQAAWEIAVEQGGTR